MEGVKFVKFLKIGCALTIAINLVTFVDSYAIPVMLC